MKKFKWFLRRDGGISFLNVLIVVFIAGDALSSPSTDAIATALVFALCALNLLTIVWFTHKAYRKAKISGQA